MPSTRPVSSASATTVLLVPKSMPMETDMGGVSREGGGALDGECVRCQAAIRNNACRHAGTFLQCRAALLRKKAAVASGPKFREETPKKGSNRATPIAE